jgi:glucose/arabinose dehydrogenase
VVRIEFRHGVPTRTSDFLTGFLSQNGERHYGRLAGIAVARDGSLLVADDANGVIYRVSYGSSNTGAR